MHKWKKYRLKMRWWRRMRIRYNPATPYDWLRFFRVAVSPSFGFPDRQRTVLRDRIKEEAPAPSGPQRMAARRWHKINVGVTPLRPFRTAHARKRVWGFKGHSGVRFIPKIGPESCPAERVIRTRVFSVTQRWQIDIRSVLPLNSKLGSATCTYST